MKYQRRNEIESAEMDQEILLYDPGNIKFCALNATAAFLWGRLEASRSFEALLGDVTNAYSVADRAAVEQDLHTILDELTRLSFVAKGEATLATPNPTVSDHETAADPLPYAPPRLRMMDETEVLSEFQVTSAGITWWMM